VPLFLKLVVQKGKFSNTYGRRIQTALNFYSRQFACISGIDGGTELAEQ
jgi:hypothetical protein